MITDLAAAVTETAARISARAADTPHPGADLPTLVDAFRALDAPAAAFLRARLTALHPTATHHDDEFGTTVPATGDAWVWDAVDGAVQLLQGLPHWAVAATFLHNGTPTAAAVHSPYLRATYTATHHDGTHLNGRPVHPSDHPLEAALICTSHPPFPTPADAARAGAALSAVLRAGAPAVRNLGPTSLQAAQVSSGHVDAFYLLGRDAVNLLPGVLIARESGALATDLAGAPWTPTSDAILIASPTLHPRLLEVLRTC